MHHVYRYFIISAVLLSLTTVSLAVPAKIANRLMAALSSKQSSLFPTTNSMMQVDNICISHNLVNSPAECKVMTV